MLGFGFKKRKVYKRNFDSVGSLNCAKSEKFAAFARNLFIYLKENFEELVFDLPVKSFFILKV